ncbi:MAG: hypothetical protein EBU84_07240 [Actinobacteria bacterium]|nr:hypothetical protein [Actinomycetota bacterium]
MSKFNEALALHNKENRLGIGKKIREKLGEDSYQDLLRALGDRSIPVPSIIRALRSLEISVSRAVMNRWRNGEPPLGADMPIVESEQS